MKILIKMLMGIAMALAGASCQDLAIEKRLDDLESRLDHLEGKNPLPVIEFDELTFYFGAINEGDKVSHTYQVKNTGQAPLIIQDVKPSCGCTVPDWTKTPIPMNGTGYVKIEFDSKGKEGIQGKTLAVTANTWPKVTTLKFIAKIIPK